MVSILGILLGIAILIAGGAALVNGASQVAAKLGVSPVVVGLTVVAFGTSMPEFVVNVLGATRGETALAFGNIVGSNIANLALVLGAAALLQPLLLHGGLVKREVPLLLLGSTVLMVLSMDTRLESTVNQIDVSDSLVLLLVFMIFVYITVNDVIRARKPDAIVAEIESNPLIVTESRMRHAGLLVLLGVGLLYAGGELTVRSSVNFAASLNIPLAEVGLFIVAVGTSMPELVTSVMAAFRKESDLAVGNVVGSNLFNTLLVLPASGVAGTIDIPAGGMIDLVFSWFLAALLIPVFIFGNALFGRSMAVFVLVAYVGWAVLRLG
jgi:cation:H+ antiporter